MIKVDAVKSYYDNNTNLFLQLGAHYATQNIHRSVWGKGVETKEASVNYVNHLVLNQIHQLAVPTPTILDLGCGVGGSLYYLAQHQPDNQYYGITISPNQVQVAHKIGMSLGLDTTCHISEGDYHQLPTHLPKVELAYAIESFLHATNPTAFF